MQPFRSVLNTSIPASTGKINWEKKFEEISQNLKEAFQKNRKNKTAASKRSKNCLKVPENHQKDTKNREKVTTETGAQAQPKSKARSESNSRPESRCESHLRIAIQKLTTDEEVNGNLTVEVIKD